MVSDNSRKLHRASVRDILYPVASRSAVPALVLTFARLPEVRLCLGSSCYTV